MIRYIQLAAKTCIQKTAERHYSLSAVHFVAPHRSHPSCSLVFRRYLMPWPVVYINPVPSSSIRYDLSRLVLNCDSCRRFVYKNPQNKELKISCLHSVYNFTSEKEKTRLPAGFFNGGEGSRTPVRRQRHIGFYGCSDSFDVTLGTPRHRIPFGSAWLSSSASRRRRLDSVSH